MAGRVPLAALTVAGALSAALATTVAAGEPTVLVRYGFDDDEVATGPDTFAVFRAAHGRVGLTSAFRLSGYRAVEIRDVAGNGDFSELQGYFPRQSAGRVFAHFALLTARPEEELDVALAGPAGFRLGRDGIAFWLSTRGGRFVHVSDSIPKKLCTVQGFVWYVVDVSYDVEAGRYDLTIREEGRPEPVVALRGQPGAASQPRSAVDKFSFISDPEEDASNVTYYVDDVVVSTSRDVAVPPLVAPGRRKLFVDAFAEYRRIEAGRPRCLPSTSLSDLGLETPDPASVRKDLMSALQRVLTQGAKDWPADRAPLLAVADWRAGCEALAGGQAEAALARFVRAREASPRGRLFALSEVLALSALGRLDEADARLAEVRPEWLDDPRYAIASAVVGVARGDLARAQEDLRAQAEASPDPLVGERYYSVLLWDGRWREARDFAVSRARAGAPSAPWLERAADAAFQLRDLAEAREIYEQALPHASDRRPILLKLSDVAFLMGDLATERQYREEYYGSLQ